jgi:glucose-1-phosphate thymidylyltransferase
MLKGIILAGGTGSRLHPLTTAVSKQLLPVYDKPMIYYPLSVLLLAGIRDILVITTKKDQSAFSSLLGDGSQWGIAISYAIQSEPRGIAEAFTIGRNFVGEASVSLILGDNIFYGRGLTTVVRKAAMQVQGATVFGYWVTDPERYGVIEFAPERVPLRIVEKPKSPPSNYAVTGLYFYDNQVLDIATSIKPSNRGELEITDVNNRYLEMGQLNALLLGRGVAWLDTGTPTALIEASEFVRVIEERQGLKIACIEEIANLMGYIDDEQVLRMANQYKDTNYGKYLRRILNYPKVTYSD